MPDRFDFHIETASAALTSGKATAAGLGASVLTMASKEEILFILTVCVLLCQLVSWGYKFRRWLKGRK